LFLPNYESKKPPEMTPGAFSSTVVDEFGRPGNAGMPVSRTRFTAYGAESSGMV
jgi:hypothetical protein